MKKQEENIFETLWGNSYTESVQDFFKQKSDKKSPLSCEGIILKVNIEDLFKLQEKKTINEAHEKMGLLK